MHQMKLLSLFKPGMFDFTPCCSEMYFIIIIFLTVHNLPKLWQYICAINPASPNTVGVYSPRGTSYSGEKSLFWHTELNVDVDVLPCVVTDGVESPVTGTSARYSDGCPPLHHTVIQLTILVKRIKISGQSEVGISLHDTHNDASTHRSSSLKSWGSTQLFYSLVIKQYFQIAKRFSFRQLPEWYVVTRIYSHNAFLYEDAEARDATGRAWHAYPFPEHVVESQIVSDPFLQSAICRSRPCNNCFGG